MVLQGAIRHIKNIIILVLGEQYIMAILNFFRECIYFFQTGLYYLKLILAFGE